MSLFLSACVVPAFVISYAATLCLRQWAPRWGLVDRPAARKVHTVPTPLGGGLAIWLGVLLPMAVVQVVIGLPTEWMPAQFRDYVGGAHFRSQQLWSILTGGTLLTVMGLLDDIHPVSWKPRLLIQFGVAIGLVSAGVTATIFVPIPWFGQLVTVIWIVVLINAFNFLDNMDGLSAGIGLIAALMFAAVMLTQSEPHWFVGGFLLIFAASVSGFLWHNWPPARIFMGDTGSYFIGLILASATVVGTFYESGGGNRHVMLAPLCILAVPLYDFCSVVLIRLRQGRSPFHPDKSHFSHRLVERGLSPRNAVLTIHLATWTTGIGGLLLYRVSDWWSASLIVSLIACVLAIIAILETTGGNRDKNQEPGPESSESDAR